MSSLLPGSHEPASSQAARATGARSQQSIAARPARDTTPRRMIVTAGVVAFAVREWSLWALLRVGPWGPPMRLVLGKESVADAVERTLDALLMWPESASLLQLKSGWLEQQVHVWGSAEQGSAVSLMHSILLRANRDELQPHLLRQPVPSLHVQWVPVADIETGTWKIDPDAQPGVLSALQALRSHISHEPAIVARYLADMGRMSSPEAEQERWRTMQVTNSSAVASSKRQGSQMSPSVQGRQLASTASRNTMPLDLLKPPATGDGTFTLAEALALYKAFFPPDESGDTDDFQRRLLALDSILALDEERAMRDYPGEQKISSVYYYSEE
jgi:hypothetical protein